MIALFNRLTVPKILNSINYNTKLKLRFEKKTKKKKKTKKIKMKPQCTTFMEVFKIP